MSNIYKFLAILLCVFTLSKKVTAINLFELSMIGVGVGFVADQYFDSSLEDTNTFELKKSIIDYHEQNNKSSVSSNYYRQLPIQEQLRLIEELNKF